MGAAGAYRIAYRWPTTFAAVIAVEGPVRMEAPYPPDEIELDHRTHKFSAAADPFAALATGIKQLPIWIFHSDSDEVVPVDESRQIVAALKRAGADVRYTEYTGLTHNATPPKAHAEDGLFAWLFSKHR
jgi:predicted peptidase